MFEPCCAAAMNTKNLQNMPAKGGMPARENKASVSKNDSLGLV